MIGAILEVASVGKERHRPWRLPRRGFNNFGVRRPDRVGGWLFARVCDRGANCVKNVISLSHGIPPWLGLGPLRCSSTLAARLFSDITVLMPRQSVISRKRRGPRPTGKGMPILVRLQPGLLANLDAWIASREISTTRPEAIRLLIAVALSTKAKS